MAGGPPASGDGKSRLDLPPLVDVPEAASLCSVAPLPSPSPVARSPCGERAAVERFGRGAPCSLPLLGLSLQRHPFKVRISLPFYPLGLGFHGRDSFSFDFLFDLH